MNKETLLNKFEEAKANAAIEGIALSDEEEQLFLHMIRLELDEEASDAMINEYRVKHRETHVKVT